MLKVEKISKDFGGLRALNEVTFEVAQGEIVGLIGPNGSGKSTAFNVITGFLPATSGMVTFNGETITGLPAHEVARRGLVRTFQLVRPFLHLTTLDNVLAGCLFGRADMVTKKAGEPRAYQVLEQVGLAPKAKVLARDLTIMERKWLEVARALAGDPTLLLLDEFMAGLNPKEIPEALALIRRLNESGITIIRPKPFCPCPGLATMKAMKAPLAKAIKVENKLLVPKKVANKRVSGQRRVDACCNGHGPNQTRWCWPGCQPGWER